MSSIPLPALHVEAPQQPDTLGNFGRLLQLKNEMAMAPLQQQEAKQAIQSNGLQIEQQKQQMKDQESFRTAMADPSMQGKTIGQVADALAQKGQISQAAWSQAKKADTEHQQALATKTKTDLENMKSAHDATQNLYNNVMSMPDDQLQAQWPAIAQQYNSIPGNEKMPMDPSKPLSKQQLSQFAPVISMGNAYFDQELARRTKESEGVTAAASAKRATDELQNGPSGPAAEAKYRFILGKMRAGTASADEQAYAKTFEASQSKTTTSSDSLGIKSVNTSGPSGTSMVRGGGGGGPRTAGTPSMTPGNSLVDEIGQGKMAINRLDNILTRRPELAQAVAQKYPDFDSSKVKSYTDAYKSFTSGKDRDQVRAGAVAIQHLADLKRINDESPSESRMPGTAAYKAFHNLLDTVADELVTFYGEPKTNEAMSSKKSTLGGLTNRDAAILEQAKAMGIKMDEMEQTWANAAPSKAYQAPMPGMSEKAKQARAALDPEFAKTYKSQASQSGGNGSGVTVTDPRGVTHAFPNQAAADAYKKAIGQ
jgi:hypothetical protein